MLSYGALGCYAFWLYAFGPAVALLRDELGFSYTTVGVYSAVWAGGAVAAGATFAPAARRWARGALLWRSALVSVLGAGLFALGGGVAVTLAGAAVLGLAGTVLLTAIQAILSDRHGEQRDRALTEANVGAGATAVLAPLALGGLGALSAGGGGWRAAFALPVVALAALWARYRHQPLPEPERHHEVAAAGGLPRACRLFALLTAVSTAIEFCLIYFGAQALAATGLSATAASTALSSNYLGILAGRVLGAGLTRRAGRTAVLLYGSLAVTAAGFAVFWTAGRPVPAVLGLFVCGLGVANLYPLALALTLSAAGGREDRANARTQLAVGAGGAASPFLLGALADGLGLRPAFGLEALLIVAGVVLLAGGLRARGPAGP